MFGIYKGYISYFGKTVTKTSSFQEFQSMGQEGRAAPFMVTFMVEVVQSRWTSKQSETEAHL